MKLLILTICLAYASADVSHLVNKSEKDASIVEQGLDMGLEGNYNWNVETSNGISASEQGRLKNPESVEAQQEAEGQASWTSPEGEKVYIRYVANENGYQVEGSHIPTPPPIPEAILRALQYISEHPPAPENK